MTILMVKPLNRIQHIFEVQVMEGRTQYGNAMACHSMTNEVEENLILHETA